MIVSRDAKDELNMYDPFVRACNYALDALSVVNDVDGLPEFSGEKQIVFVRNDDRAVLSGSHQRESRARPDIVLVQWNHFKRQQQLHDRTPYSQSYDGDICVSRSDVNLTWGAIRSTVEMKIAGLPKRGEWTRDFDTGFKALKELPPYISLDDTPQSGIFQELLPAHNCECVSFEGFRR